MKLDFFIAQAPKPKGNHKQMLRFGDKLKLVESKKNRDNENALAGRAYEHRPPSPFTGPVRLDVTFVMPIPTSLPAWKRAAALDGRLHPAKRPDRGNLLKLVEDALEGPFYVDDSQIVAGDVRKAYGEVPGYRIVLEELEEAQRGS